MLDAFELPWNHELLELLVRGVQDDGSRRLVHLAGFDAGEAVLHDIDTSDPVGPCDDLEALDELEQRHLDSIGAHGHASLEGELHVSGLLRAFVR